MGGRNKNIHEYELTSNPPADKINLRSDFDEISSNPRFP
jgi:hypothetical protein